MKQIAILGSTGSIGCQALEVIESHSEEYSVYALTANNNVDRLIEQARKFVPDTVVVANEAHYEKLKNALSDMPIKVYAGAEAISINDNRIVSFANTLHTIDGGTHEQAFRQTVTRVVNKYAHDFPSRHYQASRPLKIGYLAIH